MIKVVVFDLDDTLISERDYITSGYKHVSLVIKNKYGGNQEEIFMLLNELFAKSSLNVFNRLFDCLKIDYEKADILELVEEYRNHEPLISFYKDVLPCIELLKKSGIKLGIITDGYANAQRKKLKAVHANNFFDEIIVTDELGREFWKPHPKAFEILKQKFNVNYEEMVYVGDNPSKDFLISKTHRINTIRINRNGIHAHNSYIEEIRENHSINSLNEIIKFTINETI